MLGAGDRVLVAVSGGADSVALLAALVALSSRYRSELCVAHLNHQLRGDEARRDQQCSEMLAARLGVRSIVGCHAGLSGRSNLEARAREARYAFLTETAERQGCTKIATGHTLDDQAETVLMRLLRGTGGDGLAGIRAVRDGWVIRPLIECSRQQILAFLHAWELPYCSDSSNEDRRFLRNRVRHEVMPLLRSINPDVARQLASTAAIVAGEAGVLEQRVAMLASMPLDGGSFPVSALGQVPAELHGRLLRRWLREQRGSLHRLTAAHLRAIVSVARGRQPNARVRLPGGEMVVREYDRLRLRSWPAAAAVEPIRWLAPGSCVDLASGWRIRADVSVLEAGNWQQPRNLWHMVADAEAVRQPLMVRVPRPGDRVRPIGLAGHRKLQDIFVDRKLPLDARRTCPVVECNGEILWVPGVVRGQPGLMTPTTRRVLHLVAEKTAVAAP
jgi:tRNA(Ile)-lysidine synthase